MLNEPEPELMTLNEQPRKPWTRIMRQKSRSEPKKQNKKL